LKHLICTNSFYAAISQKKSPNVLCDIGQLHTNIILVHLNEKKLSAEDFVKRLGMVLPSHLRLIKIDKSSSASVLRLA